MFPIAVEETAGFLDFKVFFRDVSGAPLFSFRQKKNGNALLYLLNFVKELQDGDPLFVWAEKLLPKRLSGLLFYIYLNFSEREGNSPGEDRFLEFLRADCRRIEELSQQALGGNFIYQPKLLFRSGSRSRLYLIETPEEMMDFFLYFYLPDLGRTSVCKVCGAKFIPGPHQKGQLCAYEKRSGSSCTAMRCQENFQKQIDLDPLLRRYQKLYKRQYMRCERALELLCGGIKTPGDYAPFRSWSAKAGAERQAYRQGKLNAEEFAGALENLDKDIPYHL